jgi:undecaprenyl pyrophosphate phosphatase UppP
MHGLGTEDDPVFPGMHEAAAMVTGATLAAARALGFGRGGATVLSWQAGLPVIAGATALKAVRTRGFDGAAAAGAAAAFASTLACGALLRPRPLWPYAAYRTALAALVVRRLWQDRR